MDWLNRLLGTDAPAGTRLRAAELHLRGGVPAWAVALLLVAFAALAFTLYFRERLLRGWWRPVTMALLRTTALALLLGLLLRPVLVTEFVGERPRPVAVLLDTEGLDDVQRFGDRLDVMVREPRQGEEITHAALTAHGIEPREIRAKTEMLSDAECDVRIRVAPDIESERRLENVFVAIR